jgi:Na+-driven multidrug efflux pump
LGSIVAVRPGIWLGLFSDDAEGIWLGLFSDDAEVARLGAMYLRIVGPVYVFFALSLGLFFVCQGFGRGLAAMIANAVRLLVSAGVGLAAVYWLGLGVTGLFAAIAAGFCIYAALTVLAVVRISPPATPTAQ